MTSRTTCQAFLISLIWIWKVNRKTKQSHQSKSKIRILLTMTRWTHMKAVFKCWKRLTNSHRKCCLNYHQRIPKKAPKMMIPTLGTALLSLKCLPIWLTTQPGILNLVLRSTLRQTMIQRTKSIWATLCKISHLKTWHRSPMIRSTTAKPRTWSRLRRKARALKKETK